MQSQQVGFPQLDDLLQPVTSDGKQCAHGRL